MNVYEKLNVAREKFHRSKLTKSGHNKFAGYKYFELGDFIIPALEIFKEVGLSGVVSFGTQEAKLSIINIEKPEESIVITSPMSSAALKGCHEVQNLGAVQTYLRRYLWVAALEIVEHDALDATTGSQEPEFKLSQAKIADLIALIDESTNMQELKTNYGIALKECKTDQEAQKHIISAKDTKKSALGG
jgi:hypothetical protein